MIRLGSLGLWLFITIEMPFASWHLEDDMILTELLTGDASHDHLVKVGSVFLNCEVTLFFRSHLGQPPLKGRDARGQELSQGFRYKNGILIKVSFYFYKTWVVNPFLKNCPKEIRRTRNKNCKLHILRNLK